MKGPFFRFFCRSLPRRARRGLTSLLLPAGAGRQNLPKTDLNYLHAHDFNLSLTQALLQLSQRQFVDFLACLLSLCFPFLISLFPFLQGLFHHDAIFFGRCILFEVYKLPSSIARVLWCYVKRLCFSGHPRLKGAVLWLLVDEQLYPR